MQKKINKATCRHTVFGKHLVGTYKFFCKTTFLKMPNEKENRSSVVPQIIAALAGNILHILFLHVIKASLDTRFIQWLINALSM